MVLGSFCCLELTRSEDVSVLRLVFTSCYQYGLVSHLSTPLIVVVHKYILFRCSSCTTLQTFVARDNPELSGTLPSALSGLTHVRFDLEGTMVTGPLETESGSSGNSGGVPYKASRSHYGSANTYPHQDRRTNRISESFHHTTL